MSKILECLRASGIVTSVPLDTSVRCLKRSPEEVAQMVEEQTKRRRWCVDRKRAYGYSLRDRCLKGGIDWREH